MDEPRRGAPALAAPTPPVCRTARPPAARARPPRPEGRRRPHAQAAPRRHPARGRAARSRGGPPLRAAAVAFHRRATRGHAPPPRRPLRCRRPPSSRPPLPPGGLRRSGPRSAGALRAEPDGLRVGLRRPGQGTRQPGRRRAGRGAAPDRGAVARAQAGAPARAGRLGGGARRTHHGGPRDVRADPAARACRAACRRGTADHLTARGRGTANRPTAREPRHRRPPTAVADGRCTGAWDARLTDRLSTGAWRAPLTGRRWTGARAVPFGRPARDRYPATRPPGPAPRPPREDHRPPGAWHGNPPRARRLPPRPARRPSACRTVHPPPGRRRRTVRRRAARRVRPAAQRARAAAKRRARQLAAQRARRPVAPSAERRPERLQPGRPIAPGAATRRRLARGWRNSSVTPGGHRPGRCYSSVTRRGRRPGRPGDAGRPVRACARRRPGSATRRSASGRVGRLPVTPTGTERGEAATPPAGAPATRPLLGRTATGAAPAGAGSPAPAAPTRVRLARRPAVNAGVPRASSPTPSGEVVAAPPPAARPRPKRAWRVFLPRLHPLLPRPVSRDRPGPRRRRGQRVALRPARRRSARLRPDSLRSQGRRTKA